jgi:hypothetical protein
MKDNYENKFDWKLVGSVFIIVIAALAFGLEPALAAGTSYYVDCSAATNGTGTQASPWNNLTTPSGTTFAAGDSIFLKRGTTCAGQLWPKGSGTSVLPITVDAYSTGTLPIINGGTGNDAAVKVYNQQGWKFQNIEVTGGNRYGLWIGGNAGTLSYFRVTNVVVHDVTGVPTSGTGKNDGLIDIEADWPSSAIMSDVIVDGATAYSTGQWNGIRILCTGAEAFPGNAAVIVRNSTVHDVGGDGITIMTCNNGLIENTVAYNTGQITSTSFGTPNSTWTWSCKDCTVQYNEAYLAHSPGVDGGSFDIDYPDQNNIYQYNYGHDNDAYCISVFAGDTIVTLNNTIRYNICSNNVRDSSYAATKSGDVYIGVWSKGVIQDTYIYNNTFYYNPITTSYYAINMLNISRGTAVNNTNFYNNLFYSTSPSLVSIATYQAQTHMDNNLYWYTGAGNPSFKWGGSTYTSFAAFQTGSAQEANGKYVNPLLNDPTYHTNGFPTTSFTLQSGSPAINAGANLVALGIVSSMGSRDFFGNAIPQGGVYDIGAYESGGGPLPTATPTSTNTPAPPTSTPIVGPSPTPTNTPLPATNTPVGCNGATNIALNKSVVATTSVQSGDVGQNAVDGSTGTRWWTLKNNTLTEDYIVIDLGSSMTFCKAMLNQGDRYATSWNIQVSPDNINWTTAFSTNTFVANGWQTVTFNNASGRYVKYDTTAWFMSTDHTKTYEFQLYQP